MHLTLNLLPVHLVILSSAAVAYFCPQQCSCKWKGGKETVSCSTLNNNTHSMTALPANLDPDTQVLDLNGNFFSFIRAAAFLDDLGLPNLQKIYLSGCSVSDVAPGAFRGLTNLVELDLSGNALREFPAFAKDDCRHLMRLDLRANSLIRRISSGAFDALADLVHLDLSECAIESISDTSGLANLNSLEQLKLRGNKLTLIDPVKTLPSSLRGLSLDGNVWHCDCHLWPLLSWLQTSSFTTNLSSLSLRSQKKKSKMIYIRPLKCSTPRRLKGQLFMNLAEDELACEPRVRAQTDEMEVILGRNATLICTVKAQPEAKTLWRYQNTYLNNGSTLINSMEMRNYLLVDTDTESRLIIGSETGGVDLADTGDYFCQAENAAGKSEAVIRLNVVVPVPPKPPQDVLEERFNIESLIANVVASKMSTILSLVVVALILIRYRQKRPRRPSMNANNNTRNCIKDEQDVIISKSSSVETQMTITGSAFSNCSQGQHHQRHHRRRAHSTPGSSPIDLSHILLETPEEAPASSSNNALLLHLMPKEIRALSPPSQFRDEEKVIISVSERKKIRNKRQSKSKTLPRKLKPPPQYKGVHFREDVKKQEEDEDDCDSPIPTEGLPTGPAGRRLLISKEATTVPIRTKQAGPPLIKKPAISASSSMTFTSQAN